MAVEIVIISGARQGVRLGLERSEFRVGGMPDCEVFFDPQADPGVRDRAAAFRLQDDGWYVRRTGSGTIFVNHQLVQGAMRLRSGDVVRMSDRGPDFSFTIVKQLSAETLKASGPPAAAIPAAAMPAAVTPAIVTPVAEAVFVAQPVPAAVPAGRPFTAAPPRSISPAVWIMGGLALGLLLVVTLALVVVAWLFTARKPTEVVRAAPPVTIQQTPDANRVEGLPTRPPEPSKAEPAPAPRPSATAESTKAESTKAESAVKIAVPPKPDGAAVAGSQKEAVFLIEVELPLPANAAVWPLATCCAVRDDTLLTSATVAVDILRFRQQGYKVYAAQPERDFRVEVKDVRLHAAYVKLIADHPQRRFFNLALLAVEPHVPKTLALVQPEEVARLEEGLRLSCVAYSFPQVKKLTRYDHLTAEVYPGEIFLVKSPQPQAGLSPRSLDLTSPLPPNALGSPIVNAQGKLVAVYTETPTGEDARAVPNLQFATVVNPQWIEAWLNGHDDKQWIVPQLSAPAGPKTAPPASHPPASKNPPR